jgi:hypothetical protein
MDVNGSGILAPDERPAMTVPAMPAPRVRGPGRAVLLVAVVVALAVPVISASGSELPGRPVLGLLYVLAVPGVAVAALLRLPGRLASFVLAVAVSLAALLLVATAQLVAGLWSPIGTQVLLSGIAVLATAAELLRPAPDGEPSDEAFAEPPAGPFAEPDGTPA